MEERLRSVKAALWSTMLSAKVWAEQDLIRFAACSVATSSLVILLLRERSWSFLSHQQMLAIDSLEADNRMLFEKLSSLSLQHGESLQVADACGRYCNCTVDTANNAKKALPVIVYFAWTTLSQVLLLVSVKIFENINLYWCPDVAEGKAFNKQLLLKALNFLVKYSPVSTVLFFSLMSLWCLLAWLGLFDRDQFVTNAFRWLLSYYLASFAAFVVSNIVGASKYLPSDLSTLSRNVREFSWWLWLLGRAFGLNNMAITVNNLVWMALMTLSVFPIRYFFYYRHVSTKNMESSHVFFINTMGHCFLFLIACLLFYSPALLLTLLDLQEADMEVKKKVESLSFVVKMTRGWVKAWSEFAQKLWSDQQKLGLTTLFLILSVVIYAMRFLYFLWTGGCTWYAWFVSWVFIHIHIILVFFLMPGLNFLMQRLKVDKVHKQIFTDNMVAKLIAPSESNELSSIEMDEKQAKMVSDRFYEGTMCRALVFCFFNDTSSLEQDEKDKNKANNPKSDEEEADNVLTTVFKMVISDELANDEEDSQKQQSQETAGNPFPANKSQSNENLRNHNDID